MIRAARRIAFVAAIALLAGCNSTELDGAGSSLAGAPAAANTPIYTPQDAFEVGDISVTVAENLCRCGEYQERYVFILALPDDATDAVTLYYAEPLTGIAHEMEMILPDQTVWFLERLRGDDPPLVYFNFEPTYDETKTLVAGYLAGDEGITAMLSGGWVLEHETDARPDPLEWAVVSGVALSARGLRAEQP